MIDLNELRCLVQVVDHKGFSAAARALGVPKSSLNRRIIALEARLGARLIQRTSRSFVVTEIGQELYRHARAMLVEAEAAESAVKRRLAAPSGTVRFTCSIGMAGSLAQLLSRFLGTFPQVAIVQHATNRFVDLVEEGFDVGLRGHSAPLPDSGLVQRLLARTPWHMFAAPAYLDGAGTPKTAADLAAHAGLALGARGQDASWTLTGPDEAELVVAYAPRLVSDDIDTLKEAAVAGLGIVALPAYLCRREIEQGALRRVLDSWNAGDGRITLVMPSRRGLLPSVRAFVDFLVAEYPPLVRVNDASLELRSS